MRVGFVGLGDQGAPIAQRIVGAGFECAVWARRAEALDPFRDGPARIAASLRDLGEGLDLLGTCVFDAAGARQVLFGPDGAAAAMPRGSVIAVHSTVSPAEIREIAAEAADLGLRVLDAPVSGGAIKAARGELVTMVGGDARTLSECRPVFATFASQIVHLGDVGAGQKAKLINNAMLTAHIAVAADAFTLAAQLGLDRAALADVLRTGSGRSFGAEMVAATSGPQLAASQARPTLSKDVALLAELIAGNSPSVLLSVSQHLIDEWDAADA